jgi:hypothetical protein
VQTFLPYPSFAASAGALDGLRLGKQRVEAFQVLRGLRIEGYGWRHHPVIRMWRGYDQALIAYGLAVAREWVRRGHRDSVHGKIAALSQRQPPPDQDALALQGELPPWLGDPAFHRSHQSALVRKDPAHYGPLFPGVPADLPYVWPA